MANSQNAVVINHNKSNIKSKGKKPDISVHNFLHAQEFSYHLHHRYFKNTIQCDPVYFGRAYARMLNSCKRGIKFKAT